jgi:hypothetical protein
MSAPPVVEQSPVRVRRAPTLEPPFDDESGASPSPPLGQPGRGPRTQRPVTPRQPRGPIGSPPAAAPAPQPATARPALAPVPVAQSVPPPESAGRAAEAAACGPQSAALRAPEAAAGGPQSAALRAPEAAAWRVPPPAAGAAAKAATPAQAAAQRFIGVCVEILNGHRPVGHLRAVVTALDLQLVTDQLVRRTTRTYLGRPGATAPGPHRVRLRALHVGEPRDGVAELVAVLEYGINHWAMCARLERRADTWLCTLVQVL